MLCSHVLYLNRSNGMTCCQDVKPGQCYCDWEMRGLDELFFELQKVMCILIYRSLILIDKQTYIEYTGLGAPTGAA